MPRLIVLKGLPGSGKSTYAASEMKKSGNLLRVNRDELRTMLHGKDAKWSPAREKTTVSAEEAIVRGALDRYWDVIVDDTNILGRGTRLWEDNARAWNTSLGHTGVIVLREQQGTHIYTEIVDRTSIPIEDCIRYDAGREGKARVGRGVIERMALFGGLIDLSSHDRVAVVDVDGTLANLDHRLHFMQSTPKDYDSFFASVSDDAPFYPVIAAVNKLHLDGYFIIILSGRPANTGYDTDNWLKRYISFHRLFMRQTGDHRPDDQAKRQLMERMFEARLRKDAIKVIIDDRDSVCAVWREMGLPLIQVDHGSVTYTELSAMQIAYDLKIPAQVRSAASQ